MKGLCTGPLTTTDGFLDALGHRMLLLTPDCHNTVARRSREPLAASGDVITPPKPSAADVGSIPLLWWCSQNQLVGPWCDTLQSSASAPGATKKLFTQADVTPAQSAARDRAALGARRHPANRSRASRPYIHSHSGSTAANSAKKIGGVEPSVPSRRHVIGPGLAPGSGHCHRPRMLRRHPRQRWTHHVIAPYRCCPSYSRLFS